MYHYEIKMVYPLSDYNDAAATLSCSLSLALLVPCELPLLALTSAQEAVGTTRMVKLRASAIVIRVLQSVPKSPVVLLGPGRSSQYGA